MKRLISALTSLRLRQILATLLAGFLMVVTVACNGAPNVQASNFGEPNAELSGGVKGGSDKQSERGIPGHRGERYEGGMNNYSDVDPRYQGKTGVSAQAKALRDNAERNVIDMSDDVGTNTKRILDKKGENLEQFNDNVKDTSRNLGQTARRSAEDLSNVADEAGDNLRNFQKDVSKSSAGKAVKNAQENAKSAGQDLIQDAKQAVDRLGDRA